MLYAKSLSGEKILPINADRALCPICNTVVIPKRGSIRAHHWAHSSSAECDPWTEGETEWHLCWKSLFPKENVEITILKDGNYHRADVVGSDGTVIEFQHSPISPKDIQLRELFYKNMVWVFDCTFRRHGFHRVDDLRFYCPEWFGLICFKWDYGRPAYLYCKKPIYLDFSMTKLFRVVLLTPNNYGLGEYIEKDEFISKLA